MTVDQTHLQMGEMLKTQKSFRKEQMGHVNRIYYLHPFLATYLGRTLVCLVVYRLFLHL